MGPSLRIPPVRYQLQSGGHYGLTIPSTVIPGDCLIVSIDDTGYTLPAGWTNLFGGTWWKVATAADQGVVLTDPGGGVAGGFLLCYQNAAITQPLITPTSGGSTGSMTAPAITTTVNNSTVVEVWLVLATGASTLTVPTTAEDHVSVNVIGGNNYCYGVSDQTQATAGLAAAKTATIAPNCTSWVGYSLVIFPAAVPNAPVLNTPSSGTMEVLSGTPTFTWIPQPTNGDGPMNAYAFRRKTTGAYSYWNATSQTWVGSIVWNSSTANSVTFPAASWSDSSDYSWSVATQESAYNGQSAFAADFTVNGQVAPTVTVTAPTLTVFVPNPTVTWTDTVAGGTSATGFRVIVYNAAQYGAGGFVPGVGPSVYDSRNVAPFANTFTLPAYAIPDGVYRAYVQVVETGNVTSAWSYTAFSLSIELPASPSLTATGGTDPVTGAPLVTLVLAAHDNLLSTVDASFETGTGSYTGTNATLAQSSVAMEDGTFSLKLTAVASGAMSAKTTPYTI